MLVESARLTRGEKNKLFDISRLRESAFQALIVPPFALKDDADDAAVEEVHNVPAVRSVIQEFNIKGKIIMPVGQSAIKLVARSLDAPHVIATSDKPKLMYNRKLNLLSLSYKQDPFDLGVFDDTLRSAVVSLKYRVLK